MMAASARTWSCMVLSWMDSTRALSSDSAEALLFWLVREKETEEGKEK